MGLSITLKQLEEESIDYILWEGYSDENPQSNELFNAFTKEWCPNINRSESVIHFDGDSAFKNKHVFFVRQTQIDILKYAKTNNLNKILLLEDDIVLVNPNLIQNFCAIEHNLPKWDVLGLGVNQDLEDMDLESRFDIPLKNIPKNEDNFMKYYHRTIQSYGAFGLAFSKNIFDELLRVYDYQTSGICTDVPIDCLDLYRARKQVLKRIDISINIFPTLILPDVTDSTHTQNINELHWIQNHTLLSSANLTKFFSKYYDLRFPEKSHPHISGKMIKKVMNLFNG